MPLLKINAGPEGPELDGGGDLDAALAEALADLPEDAPVLVLIHGYRFSPFSDTRSPHSHILSLTPRNGCWKALSWPRHLGFHRPAAQAGLCIAFGWEARGSLWRAWDAADAAGAVLADLIGRMRGRRIEVVAHSLGARVALAAFPALEAGSVGRMVLMAAAEFQSTALERMQSPAGCTAEVINITSRENDLFDLMLEWTIRAPVAGDRALGAGLPESGANWLDIQIDCATTRSRLTYFGYRVPAPKRRVCHWSAYLRPGLFALYRDLIRSPEALPLAVLRHHLPPVTAPRWSRLLEWPSLSLPIPALPRFRF